MNSKTPTRGALIAIGVGILGGLALVLLSIQADRFAGLTGAQIEIHTNGLDMRTGRDLALPRSGWVLQVVLPEAIPDSVRDTLEVQLRAERTGAVIDIVDRLELRGRVASMVVPESLALYTGLLSVKATLTDDKGSQLEAYRRLRIRNWLGGPPIGSRQIIHFDFSIDRDADGEPDFREDLGLLGLTGTAPSETRDAVARAIALRAHARVLRAYDADHDPNGTRASRDQVYVRFLLEAEPSPFVTRVCVGGANPIHPGSIGYVRYDPENSRRGGQKCDGETISGVFPAELSIYAESDLYLEILSPFLASTGGTSIGDRAGDALHLALITSDGADPETRVLDGRARQILRAIEILGDALGTVMAHESAHALGLVAAGRPGVGLFGGGEEDGDLYAHNMAIEGGPPTEPWLMNAGQGFRFEELAGKSESGELRFRPINYAYLKDRVVLVKGRSVR